jgi:DNA repair protein RadC
VSAARAAGDHGPPRPRRAADEEAPYTVRILDLPRDERPRERLLRAGPSALSNAELIAILLRVGIEGESALDVAARLLADHGLDGLQRLDADLLAGERGLGPAKAAQIKAALELGVRLAALRPEQRPRISGPDDVTALLGAEMAALEQEELRILLLNTKNEVLAVHSVYVGSVNRTQVRIGEMLRPGVTRNAHGVIAVHNHPSGDPTPSRDDVRMTKQLVEAGKLLDVRVLDHIVIGEGGRWASLMTEGLLD